MNFQSLPKIETPDFYLDVAFRRAKQRVGSMPKHREDRLHRVIRLESAGVAVAGGQLAQRLLGILTAFPSLDSLPPFYHALAKATLDYGEVKHALGGVNWAVGKITEFTRQYSRLVRLARSEDVVYQQKRAFYGRISSAVKQIKKELETLEAARLVMKEFPHVKTSLRTIVIAGYPNVGKTTLLRAMTGSAPQIAAYPFTTQQLMLGYYTYRNEKFQVMDTPGMLDRPLAEMNAIEKQAALALQHVATLIVFIIDPSEHCGYSTAVQLSLLRQVRKQFSVPVLVVANKADMDKTAAKKLQDDAKETFLVISAEKGTGVATLKRRASQPLR